MIIMFILMMIIIVIMVMMIIIVIMAMMMMMAIKMPIQRSRQSPISSFPDQTKALYLAVYGGQPS